MNAERLADLMKLGLIQRKKAVLANLGEYAYLWDPESDISPLRSTIMRARAREVEEIEALLRSDLAKRAREILEAAK